MIIRVRVGSSSGFESEPLEFEIPDKGALVTLVRTARAMGLYNPSPISAEDCAQIGYAWRGHWKEWLKKYGHYVVHYTFMAIYYVLILVLVEHTLREQLLQQTLFQCITRRKTEHSAISCGNYVPFSMQRYEIFQRTKALNRANFTPKLYNATLQSDYSVGI